MTIMGTFIVGAFVVSTFFSSFAKEFRVELLKKKQLSRSGLFAGYAILDLTFVGAIPAKILSIFYKKITAETDEPERLKQKRELDFVTKAPSLQGFIEGVENHFKEISSVQYMQRLGHFDDEMIKRRLEQKYEKELQMKTIHRESRRISLRIPARLEGNSTPVGWTFRRKLFMFLAQPLMSNFIAFLVMIQCGFLAFYGFVDDNYLDIANVSLCFVFFVEICLKLYSYGWHPVS